MLLKFANVTSMRCLTGIASREDWEVSQNDSVSGKLSKLNEHRTHALFLNMKRKTDGLKSQNFIYKKSDNSPMDLTD